MELENNTILEGSVEKKIVPGLALGHINKDLDKTIVVEEKEGLALGLVN
jgi:hypothetical protein